ncbi:SH3 domain-containing protein [Clostridium bovifaecis]|uniref:SH3 domain-containing protein n=1 Tax=Clostridium bovifaecis TaxID=2184719 RepID=A0A6I6F9T6_9CLOT|nr:SH3 domain-containing protein [Clostridium bovifaecis]
MKKNVITLTLIILFLSGQTVSASTGEITASSLRVRSKSSLSSSVIGYLYKNNKVDTYSKEGDFYKINYKGKSGYIHSSYVKILPSENNQTTINNQGATSSTKIGQTTASFLNVRSGASTGYAVIGGLSRGTKVDLYENVNGFYKINYKGKTGYISDDYIKVLEENSLENNEQYDSKINVDDIIDYAKSFLGMPYAISGTTPARYDSAGKYIGGGFDCSGYTQYILKKFEITLPRISKDQANIGTTVNINNLQKGDLLFFATNPSKPSEISHVGMYIGDNKFIHSPKVNDVIKVSEFDGYFRSHFIVARRVVE